MRYSRPELLVEWNFLLGRKCHLRLWRLFLDALSFLFRGQSNSLSVTYEPKVCFASIISSHIGASSDSGPRDSKVLAPSDVLRDCFALTLYVCAHTICRGPIVLLISSLLAVKDRAKRWKRDLIRLFHVLLAQGYQRQDGVDRRQRCTRHSASGDLCVCT